MPNESYDWKKDDAATAQPDKPDAEFAFILKQKYQYDVSGECPHDAVIGIQQCDFGEQYQAKQKTSDDSA